MAMHDRRSWSAKGYLVAGCPREGSRGNIVKYSSSLDFDRETGCSHWLASPSSSWVRTAYLIPRWRRQKFGRSEKDNNDYTRFDVMLSSAPQEAAANGAAATSPAAAAGYEPRRSNRVAGHADLAQADGDTWRERIAVCEGATAEGAPRLLVRSYFRNKRTGQRVWDEPPSGASNIRFATAEERRKADVQLNELRFTLDLIPPDDEQQEPAALAPSAGKESGKKKGFLSRFRRKDKPAPQINDSQDLNLQRAIARSMADHRRSGGSGSDDPVVYYDPDSNNDSGRGLVTPGSNRSSNYDNDDDDLAMAKALSMSESQQHQTMTEEEMILLAVEESKREVQPADTKISSPFDGDIALGDQKMPAAVVARNEDVPTSSNLPSSFDPYAPGGDGVDSHGGSHGGGNIHPLSAGTTTVPPSSGSGEGAHNATGHNRKGSSGRIVSNIFRKGRKAMEEKAGVV